MTCGTLSRISLTAAVFLPCVNSARSDEIRRLSTLRPQTIRPKRISSRPRLDMCWGGHRPATHWSNSGTGNAMKPCLEANSPLAQPPLSAPMDPRETGYLQSSFYLFNLERPAARQSANTKGLRRFNDHGRSEL
jgi:hypothetical protein